MKHALTRIDFSKFWLRVRLYWYCTLSKNCRVITFLKMFLYLPNIVMRFILFGVIKSSSNFTLLFLRWNFFSYILRIWQHLHHELRVVSHKFDAFLPLLLVLLRLLLNLLVQRLHVRALFLHILTYFLVADNFTFSHHTFHFTHNAEQSFRIYQSTCQFISFVEQEIYFNIIQHITL
jgi:hypothetical protein